MQYKSYKQFLSEKFPFYKNVRKVCLNAGFSCPNLDGKISTEGCAYCNNGSFSSVTGMHISVLEQLENGIKAIKNAKKKNNENTGILAYFQSYTNTYAPISKLKETFMPVILNNDVAGISIGTRPDCLSDSVVDLLAEFGKIKPIIVEIGVQTANNETLKNINRGHTVECVIEATKLCKSKNITITSHIIIGLPNETIKDFLYTAKLIKECGFSAVKIHPLHIVKETRFAEDYQKGKIKLLSLEEYCKAAKEVINILSPNIAIERVSAESPREMLIAPNWCCDRESIRKLIYA